MASWRYYPLQKMLFIILCALLTSTAATGIDADLHTEWNNFKLTHAKEYKTPEEEKRRLEIFQENLKTIKEQNARYEAGIDTHYLGITPFADLTNEEFLESTICGSQEAQQDPAVPVFRSSGFKAPPSYNWWYYQPKIVQRPRSQGSCCSCWAHTAVEMAESHASLMLNFTYNPLSPQNLVDCVPNHCANGSVASALDYIKQYGVAFERDYPYVAYAGVCRSIPSAHIGGFYWITNEVDMKEALVSNGPIGVSIDAREWQLYRGGIFTARNAYVDVTHALVVDGYGNQNGLDYWLLRNSWNPYWGENGFIRIRRNTNEFGVGNYPLVIV